MANPLKSSNNVKSFCHRQQCEGLYPAMRAYFQELFHIHFKILGFLGRTINGWELWSSRRKTVHFQFVYCNSSSLNCWATDIKRKKVEQMSQIFNNDIQFLPPMSIIWIILSLNRLNVWVILKYLYKKHNHYKKSSHTYMHYKKHDL